MQQKIAKYLIFCAPNLAIRPAGNRSYRQQPRGFWAGRALAKPALHYFVALRLVTKSCPLALESDIQSDIIRRHYFGKTPLKLSLVLITRLPAFHRVPESI
jgi:hypothetical protein